MPGYRKREINVKGVDMPHNLEAEQALLGCMMLDPDIQPETIAKLKDSDFYTESHKKIYDVMRDLSATSTPIDFVTVTDKLDSEGELESAGGIKYLTDLTEIIPSSANYKHYLDIVLRDGLLRRLIKCSAEIIQNSQKAQDKQDALSFAEKEIFDISAQEENGSLATIREVLPEVMKRFDAVNKDKNAFRGMMTGYKGLDYLLNGLQKTDLVLIAARPSVGKTAFALNIAENIATTQDKTVAIFSLEMGKEQLAQRLLCSLAEISSESANRGTLTPNEWIKIAHAREKLNKSRIFIDDSTLITPPEMLSKCRRLKRQHGLDLVVVDYIQLMTMGGKNTESRQQEVSEISRSLKILAKELNIPVIALSQLSRSVEQRPDKRPMLSDLRESGAIEQDADIVMFIHRPDKDAKPEELASGAVKPNHAKIIIAKHRSGALGEEELFFKGECTKFMNLADVSERDRRTEETAGIGEKPGFGKTDDADGDYIPVSDEFVPPEEEPPFDTAGEERKGDLKKLSPDDEIFGN
ncbi:MAG TPA: replicative DNA helicase [Clostridiales bacterium]|nr:replicative DNA helicase [Clostridiales bacterium]